MDLSNLNFSEELKKLYQTILMQQHSVAYNKMIAGFSSTANQQSIIPRLPTPAILPFNPNCFSYFAENAIEIRREDIECDPEIIIVRSLRDSLISLGTNLNGLRGKKFGFREVIEVALDRPAYPASPDLSLTKRNRTTMEAFDAPNSTISQGSEPFNEEEGNSAKMIRYDSESSDSSISGSSDQSENVPKKKLLGKKLEDNIETDKTQKADINKEEIKEEIEEIEPTPSNIRIERMRNIQREKPKFDVSDLELSYHSKMARKFPGSEFRTPDQQVRRDKNTLAARISRTKNKAYMRMLEKQSIEATSDNITIKRKIACLRVYAASLMQMNGYPSTDFSKMWEDNMKDMTI